MAANLKEELVFKLCLASFAKKAWMNDSKNDPNVDTETWVQEFQKFSEIPDEIQDFVVEQVNAFLDTIPEDEVFKRFTQMLYNDYLSTVSKLAGEINGK